MFLAFVRVIGMATGAAWMILIPPLYFFAAPGILWSAYIGCLVPALCFVGGFYFTYMNFRKELRPFLIAVLGGTFARLVLIGLVFVWLIKMTQLHIASFLVSLVGFYMLYLMIEVYFLNQLQHQEGN